MARIRPVRIIPLGGTGEVGKNATVIEYGSDVVLVDAGVKFPEEEQLGVDLVIPDFTYLHQNIDRLRGILLTHGHEDHIGAVPYLLSQMGRRLPIFGAPLTLGMLEGKLKEHKVLKLAEMYRVSPVDTVRLGSIEARFFRVNHSVPDALAIVLQTPAGLVLHTGDFKLGEGGVDAAPTDLVDLRRTVERGVLVLLSDCVRVEEPGRTPPEEVVGETLDRLIAEAPGRVILTTFASNIIRMRQAIRAAHRHGRKVAVAGRSMEENLRVASELGYLDIPKGALVKVEEARKLSPREVMFITTGSQGEPTSVLARIAVGDHPQIAIRPDDTVILAATPVPGNEETVSQTIDNLFRRGARVVYRAVVETVHVSGHASRDELREMIVMARPEFCVPVHGEYRHMVLYREVAQETGIAPSRVFLADIGEVLEFAPGMGRKRGRIPAGSVLVDGLTVGGVTKVVLRDRRRLAEEGVLIVALAVDRETGELLAGPDLIARGFVRPLDGNIEEQAKLELRQALRRRPRGEPEPGFLSSKSKEVLGRFIYQQTGQRPLILTVVTEI